MNILLKLHVLNMYETEICLIMKLYAYETELQINYY